MTKEEKKSTWCIKCGQEPKTRFVTRFKNHEVEDQWCLKCRYGYILTFANDYFNAERYWRREKIKLFFERRLFKPGEHGIIYTKRWKLITLLSKILFF